jgi:SEC-C motif-containing protein
MSEFCPCGNKTEYSDCCGQFHKGNDFPETAEKLMRSRYTAFAKGNINYLINTHHPAYFKPADIQALETTFNDCRWLKLEIIKCEKGGKEDTTGSVQFRADYEEDGKTYTMEEKSFFTRAAGKWVYQSAL